MMGALINEELSSREPAGFIPIEQTDGEESRRGERGEMS